MPKTKDSTVRVRFAPSPTGFMHIGGLRSALFNYLYARKTSGKFILRIEDTDRERLIPEAIDHLIESLDWLGILPDEGYSANTEPHGPYVQSERLKTYIQYADELVKKGLAYHDYTTPEELEKLRKTAQSRKEPFRFTKEIATLNPKTAGDKSVVRFQIQPGKAVEWNDLVQGPQKWEREVLDDFVALKSDGYPTYNFAMVVDDHLMEISHVFRGQEFLATTPKQILVFEAFGWEAPNFVHLPQVLGTDKAKLSKRHGAKSALDYRDLGYLPETLLNYLASLGFNDGSTQEIYSRKELVEAFDLDRVQSSPAIFDPERFEWMNGMYIRNLEVDELFKRVEDFWPEEAKKFDAQYKKRILPLIQERLKYFAELPELTTFFFSDPAIGKSEKAQLKKLAGDDAESMLNEAAVWLDSIAFTEKDIEKRLRELAENGDYKTGKLFGLIRIAVTGKTAAPGLFETLATLGKDTSLRRLHNAIDGLLSP